MKTMREFRLAVESSPDNPVCHGELARAHLKRHEHQEGLRCLREVTRLARDVAEAHYQLGAALANLGRVDEATESLERALALDRDHLPALNRLAWLCTLRPATTPRARDLFLRALRREPGHIGRSVGFCHTLVAEGGAVPRLRTAALQMLGPAHDPAIVELSLSYALTRYGRYEEAMQGAADLQRRDSTRLVFLQCAHLALALRETDAARWYFAQAIAQHPDDQDVIVRYVQFLIRIGEYRQAQAFYRRPETQRAMHAGFPDGWWDGSRLSGRSVLFRSWGGYGDMIHFGRFAQWLGAEGATVVFESVQPMQELLRSIPHVSAVVLPYDDPTRCDVHSDARAAMLLLDWDLPIVDGPYLHVSREHETRWARRVGPARVFHVGLAWRPGFSTDSRDDTYASRGMVAEQLRPLMDLPGVVFHNLCAGRASEDELDALAPPMRIDRLSTGFDTFSDTAAAMLALDLVVSVDTSLIHLAGALGKPAILLLPYYSPWRWTDEARSCVWYAHCDIVRQPAPGDWPAVIAAVRAEIQRRAAGGAEAAPLAEGSRYEEPGIPAAGPADHAH